MHLLILLALLLFNALLTMSEMAIVTAHKGRLTRRAQLGSSGARTALNMLAQPERFLATIQVGITLVSILSGALAGSALTGPVANWMIRIPLLADHSQTAAWIVTMGLVVYLNLVFGELVPKRLALHYPEALASWSAPLLRTGSRIATPVVWWLDFSTRTVLRVLQVPSTPKPAVTEEDIRQLVAEGTAAGVLATQEHELVQRVLALEDTPVGRIMHPRSEVIWLDLQGSAEDNMKRVRSCNHSRFPVCQGTLDHVVGIALTHDLLAENSRLLTGLSDVLQSPLLLPSHLSALQVLEQFKRSGVHLGLVVDEFGTVQGLVTVNDVMEAMVGDLPAEGEEEGDLATRREDGSWLLDGSIELGTMTQLTSLTIPSSEHYRTLAGFIIHRLGKIPMAGDAVNVDGHRLEVVDMDRHRVDKVLLTMKE